MPIYEYQCVDCDQRIERLQRVDDPAPEACETCGGSMTRQVSAPAFQFKGTGWYVTDYANRTGPESPGESPESESKGSESKGSESKGSEGKGPEKSTGASSTGDKSTKSGSDSAKKEAPAKAASSSAKTAGASD